MNAILIDVKQISKNFFLVLTFLLFLSSYIFMYSTNKWPSAYLCIWAQTSVHRAECFDRSPIHANSMAL